MSKESPVFVSTYGGGIRRKGRLRHEVDRIFRAGNGPAICDLSDLCVSCAVALVLGVAPADVSANRGEG